MDTTAAQHTTTTAVVDRRQTGRRSLSIPLVPLLRAGAAAESGCPTMAAMATQARWVGPQRCLVAALWSEASTAA